jgi:FtsP/CotA-like multicopper oxidase with cupredoxin domain
MDFHAAETAPNRAYIDVQPGKSFEFEWEAVQPGMHMYHCATAPALHHIGNGMYGMVIVEPKASSARRPASTHSSRASCISEVRTRWGISPR